MDAFKDWASRLGTGEQTLIEMDKKLAKIHDKVEELDAFHALIKRHEEREKEIHSDLLRRIKALEEREEKNHDVLIDEGVMRHIEKMVEARMRGRGADSGVATPPIAATVEFVQPPPKPPVDDLFALIFGEKFMECNGVKIRSITYTSQLVKSLLTETKKVFVKEYIAYLDYTYAKSFVLGPMGIVQQNQYFTRLNYLNLITNNGNIYSVEFKVLIGYGATNGNWMGGISAPSVDDHHYNVDIKFVKVASFKPVEENWRLVKAHTMKNGTEETPGRSILTILSHFGK
jgi:hypothetical protein